MEEWRDIPGFEGFYAVSNKGRIKSLPRKQSPNEKYLNPSDVGTALLTGISAKRKTLNANVGVFVLLAFVGPRSTGQHCCHNDGNYKNNNLENLRWDTASANIADKIKHGTSGKGSKNPNASLTDEQIAYVKKRLTNPYHGIQKELAAELSVTQQNISLIKKGHIHK
jgi:hypothetical protein